jgi:small subunit ribosomal protein S9
MNESAANLSRQNPIWAVGRRKTAVARVRVIPGEGRIFVNSQSVKEFFGGHERQVAAVMAPLKVLPKQLTNVDFFVNTLGGGVTGQAEAVRHGVARALIQIDPKWQPLMRKNGFLTRDPRMVERKKAGQPKARARFQHSKR